MNKDNAKKILGALIEAGAAANILPFLMAQIAHETGGFNSKVLASDNNASGVMFINNSSKQKDAVKGSAFPSKEGKHFYARFGSLKSWAKDYLRILGNTPQKATNLADFASKLKANGYYTDTVANYTKGLQSWAKQIASITPPNIDIKTTVILPIILLVTLFF